MHMSYVLILGEGNVYLLQYSCLENSMDRGAWGCKESDTTEQLTHTHMYTYLYGSIKNECQSNTRDKREESELVTRGRN